MTPSSPGPTSRIYLSQRLRLHYVDWGNASAPPLLLVHGGRDQIVPTRFTQALYAAAPEPKEIWFSADAGHEDLAGFGALDAAFDFLRRRLGFQPGQSR